MLPVGIHKSVPYCQYNDHPAIRSSHLKILLKETPADLKHALESWESKSTDALLKGELLHAMLLEPDTVEHRFVIEKTPLKNKNKLEINGGSKEAWDALKAQSDAYDRPIISHDIYRDCQGMADSVRKNSTTWQNVERFADKELTCIADIDGVRCKVRLDAILGIPGQPSVIIDIKTTSGGLSDREIQKTIVDWEYQFSAAMYTTVAEVLGIPVMKFRWLFLQSQAPYQWRLIDATPEMIERGRMEFRKTLEIYRMAAETNNWTGYFGSRPDPIGLPDWYRKRVYAWGTFE